MRLAACAVGPSVRRTADGPHSGQVIGTDGDGGRVGTDGDDVKDRRPRLGPSSGKFPACVITGYVTDHLTVGKFVLFCERLNLLCF